jgi:hypothetical protein
MLNIDSRDLGEDTQGGLKAQPFIAFEHYARTQKSQDTAAVLLEKFLDIAIARNEVGTKTFHRVDMHFVEPIAILISSILTLSMAHTFMLIPLGDKPCINFVFISEY